MTSDEPPEFATRQDLANAVGGSGVLRLVLDGIRAKEMPDSETRAAWQAVEDVVEDLDRAMERVSALLPESALSKRLRGSRG